MTESGDFPVRPVENTPALSVLQKARPAPQPLLPVPNGLLKKPLFQYSVGPTVTQVGIVSTIGMPDLLRSIVGTMPISMT
jgi:hypothetical protein